jgi:hypothetical protein
MQNGLAIKKKEQLARFKPATGTTAALFNRGKAGKLIPT